MEGKWKVIIHGITTKLRYIKCHSIFYFSLLHSLFHFCGQKELFIIAFIDLLDILPSKSLKIILCSQYILQVFRGLENIPTGQTLGTKYIHNGTYI